VGRVIKRLKKCGILKGPINDAIVKAVRKRRLKPRYAIRGSLRVMKLRRLGVW
jgi:hypothetical protein